MLPAVIVCCFVFMCPESPRWYISKNRHNKAWLSIQRLRFNKVQAARDLFYIQFLIKAEEEAATAGQNKVREMVSVPRNRRAMVASEIVMFMQQVCFQYASLQDILLISPSSRASTSSLIIHPKSLSRQIFQN